MALLRSCTTGFVLALGLAGCAEASDAPGSSEADYTSGENPFDLVAYDFELTPVASQVGSNDCNVEVTAWTDEEAPIGGGKHHVTRAGESVTGQFSMRRYERVRSLYYTIRCKGSDENPGGYYGRARIGDGLDPNLGNAMKDIPLTPESDIMADMRFRASVAGVTPATDVEPGNCQAGAKDPLYVRVRTSLYKKYGGLQGPYGNDFTQTITLDGATKASFHPQAEADTSLLFTYCPAAGAVEKVHVDLRLVEDDLIANDEYTPSSADVSVNTFQRMGHSATSTAASASFPSWVTVRR